MRHTTAFASCFTLALLTTGAAQAQKVAPGLWENTVTMRSGSGQMEAAMAQMREQMAKMTPEQRKQMEAMMASRGAGAGAGAGIASGQPTTVKVCITPEQAASDDFGRHDGNCSTTSKERKGNTVHIKFACTGERKTTGEGEFTVSSDKAHRGHMVMDTVMKGQPERLELDTVGRWLSTDCGAVKPRPGK